MLSVFFCVCFGFDEHVKLFFWFIYKHIVWCDLWKKVIECVSCMCVIWSSFVFHLPQATEQIYFDDYIVIKLFFFFLLLKGILSPPGPFLTPSPSSQILQPSISPSPSSIQLPYQQQQQTTTNTSTFVSGTSGTTTHDQVQEQRVKTPNSRRSSLTQSIQSSPNAGGTAVTYRPSPTQSPAHLSTSVACTTTYNNNTTFGTVPAGHEFNTTLVGSNNISLNKVSASSFDCFVFFH